MRILNRSAILHRAQLQAGQAAKALGLSRETFKDYVARGEAPKGTKIGNKTVWFEDELEQWVINQNPHLQARGDQMLRAKKLEAQIINFRAKQAQT